jgi:hypothetical protein
MIFLYTMYGLLISMPGPRKGKGGVGCLTPLSTIFQLCRGGQF